MTGAFLLAAGILACTPGRAVAAPSPNRSVAGAAPTRSLSGGACEDSPLGWTDSEGYSCAQHETYRWCTSSGGYGDGYDTSWGTWMFWANQGVGADQACCICGGGTTGSAPAPAPSTPSSPAWAPTPGQMCVDEPFWVDVAGFDCLAYAKVGAELCNGRGGVGPGWAATGLAPNLDALAPDSGVSAADACCNCGGGMLCADSEGSAVDARGDNCADGYTVEPYEVCHMYDDEDFSAGHMCCLCLGIRHPSEVQIIGEGCVDSPDGWADLYGFSCETYSEDVGAGWCSTSGGFGSKWDVSWGSWETLVNMGHHAAEACCACGGGFRVSGTATSTTTPGTKTSTTITATTSTTLFTVTTTSPTPAPPTPVPGTDTATTHTTTLTTVTQVNHVVQQRLTFQSTGSAEEISEVIRSSVQQVALMDASDVLLVFVKPASSQPFRRLTQSMAMSLWHADYQLIMQTESLASNKARYIASVVHVWKFELRTDFQAKGLNFDETSLVVEEATYKAYAITAALTGETAPDPTTAAVVTTTRRTRPVVIGAASLPTTTLPASAVAVQPASGEPVEAQASSTGAIIACVSAAFVIGGCAAGAIFMQHRRKRLNANNNNNNNLNLNRRRSPVDDVQI